MTRVKERLQATWRQKKVLVVDDDPDTLAVLSHLFNQEGLQTHTASSGEEGMSRFYAIQPDLLILDVMMPRMDGWEVCQHLRQISTLPIIMLSVLDRDEDIVKGLKVGADDYVTKPFSTKVLWARAKAILQRMSRPPKNADRLIYRDGYLTIDVTRRQVIVRDQAIRLARKERQLLHYLFQHAGQIMPIEQILAHIWGPDYQDSPNYVHVHISRLRQKLEDDPQNPKYILTEHGVGYWFALHPTG